MERSLRELVKEKIIIYDTRINTLISNIRITLAHFNILITSADSLILNIKSNIVPKIEKLLNNINNLFKIFKFILYVILAILILMFIKMLGVLPFSP